MRDDILSYQDMVAREQISFQAGMNFHTRPGYSILLMSTRKNAPYRDRWDDVRGILLYEGHDAKNVQGGPDPKSLDQPLHYPSGNLTQNGKSYEAARRAAAGQGAPEKVRVYEKLDTGVWSDKGIFDLIDAELVQRSNRQVVDFHLRPTEDRSTNADHAIPHTRLIPTHVKIEVWKRDRGQCVQCGSRTNLHYDHDLPYSRGGTSLSALNVRILCAKCNLSKSDKIE